MAMGHIRFGCYPHNPTSHCLHFLVSYVYLKCTRSAVFCRGKDSMLHSCSMNSRKTSCCLQYRSVQTNLEEADELLFPMEMPLHSTAALLQLHNMHISEPADCVIGFQARRKFAVLCKGQSSTTPSAMQCNPAGTGIPSSRRSSTAYSTAVNNAGQNMNVASNSLSLKGKNIISLKILKDWFEVCCKVMIARKTSIGSTASALIPGTGFSGNGKCFLLKSAEF